MSNSLCQRCSSSRLIDISGKCSDMFHASSAKEHNGYVLEGLGIGVGDYLEFIHCLNCGQIQGKWPLPQVDIEDPKPKCEECGCLEFQFTAFNLHKKCTYCGAIKHDDES